MGDWGGGGEEEIFGPTTLLARFAEELRRGDRGGRFWNKRGDLCVLGVSKGLRERLEKVSRAGEDVG